MGTRAPSLRVDHPPEPLARQESGGGEQPALYRLGEMAQRKQHCHDRQARSPHDFTAKSQHPGELGTHGGAGRLDAGQGKAEEQRGHREVENRQREAPAASHVRAHKIARAPEHRDGGEADDGGHRQVAHGRPRLQGPQKHRPAQRAREVGAVDRQQGNEQPGPAEPGDGAGGEAPIESSGSRQAATGHPFPRFTAKQAPSHRKCLKIGGIPEKLNLS
jgi:hypothetical protein